ncbi:MAG: hypothetical protein IJD13_06435, partial [Oscillospiraceae bacterium]|nr:hypothetical protein [Oscillospiraceae bacterium]
MKKILGLMMSLILIAGCTAAPSESRPESITPSEPVSELTSAPPSEPSSEPLPESSSVPDVPSEEVYTGIFAEYMPRAKEMAAEMTVERKLAQIILS